MHQALSSVVAELLFPESQGGPEVIPDTVAEIRDPVHGYIKITEAEREVIDSPVRPAAQEDPPAGRRRTSSIPGQSTPASTTCWAPCMSPGR